MVDRMAASIPERQWVHLLRSFGTSWISLYDCLCVCIKTFLLTMGEIKTLLKYVPQKDCVHSGYVFCRYKCSWSLNTRFISKHPPVS